MVFSMVYLNLRILSFLRPCWHTTSFFWNKWLVYFASLYSSVSDNYMLGMHTLCLCFIYYFSQLLEESDPKHLPIVVLDIAPVVLCIKCHPLLFEPGPILHYNLKVKYIHQNWLLTARNHDYWFIISGKQCIHQLVN